MRAFEAEASEPFANFAAAHEKLPQKSCPVVFDHDDDRALIDRKMRCRIPISRLAEGVDEAVFAPEALAEACVKMPQRRERMCGRVRHGRERSRRRRHT